MKLGLAISTHNRYEVFKKNYEQWLEYLPEGYILEVIDDASDFSVPEATYRFENNVGIAKSKNMALKRLYEQGVTDFFLVDDDVRPLTKDWWKPYVEHPEPHLMAIFTGFGNQTAGIKEIYRDDKTVAYNGVRGYFLYYNKICMDTVGGFDIAYGKYFGEHTDLTNRIHNAGLTTYRAMDVPNSAQLIHSMDEHQEVISTVSGDEYNVLAAKNRRLKRMNINSKEYKDFK